MLIIRNGALAEILTQLSIYANISTSYFSELTNFEKSGLAIESMLLYEFNELLTLIRSEYV